MAIATLLALIFLCKGLSAGPVPLPVNDRPCYNFVLPVEATAQNYEYNIVPVEDNINATAYAIDLDTWTFNATERTIRNFTVSDTFNISAQLCVAPTGSKKENLIIATHGGLFDKRYWDPALDRKEYSFVNAAVEAGYSILTYDRLGTGESDKPDGYTIVQAPLQLEILRSITNLARSGDLLKTASAKTPRPGRTPAADTTTFDKIIHIGHSFGSVLTSAFLNTYGSESDAAVLTGFIPNPHFAEMQKSAFGLAYAPLSSTNFSDRGPGYMVSDAVSGVQTIFFSTKQDLESGVGGFDNKILEYAYDIRQTITAAEFVPAPLKQGPAKEFKGPLQFMLAEFDYPVCRGDCNVVDRELLKSLYPGATDIDVYTAKGNGHALTMHRDATVGYQATFDWLAKNGL